MQSNVDRDVENRAGEGPANVVAVKIEGDDGG
jgi:hypothetical protein